MTEQHQQGLANAAARAANDPFFLGCLLEAIIGSGRATRESLASMLGLRAAQLFELYLCRAPRAEAPAFREDVTRIAGFVGCDSTALARLVREASSLHSLRGAGSQQTSSFLLAARDRIDPTSPGGAPKVPDA